MRVSVFTTGTDPKRRGDTLVGLDSYAGFADEIVYVNGSEKPVDSAPGIKAVNSSWPEEFSWDFIGQQFQRGYEAATGDWVIHADLDFVFHEADYDSIREAFEYHNDAPALSFWKHQFVRPDRYNLKSRLVIAVNKGKYGDRIRFDAGGDLCQPSLDGEELQEKSMPQARIPFFNYEKLWKTEEQIKDDVQRMARAWTRHFKNNHLGTDETAYELWLKMAYGRGSKKQEQVSLSYHPKVVQEQLCSMTPDQFGYDGFGFWERSPYVENIVSSR